MANTDENNLPVPDENDEEEEETEAEEQTAEEPTPAELTTEEPIEEGKIGNMPIYRPTLGDFKLKLLIYGKAGVGKTTLAATANLHPLTKPALLVAVDPGVLALADIGWAPSTVNLTTYQQLGYVFRYLQSPSNPFKTVIIDSISELQFINLDAISKSKLKDRKGHEEDVYQEDYGDSTRQIRKAVRAFRDLPMHVIFTAHESADMDKDRERYVYPSLTPKLRTAVLGYMDVIGYLYTQTTDKPPAPPIVRRRLLTQPIGKWEAKDRSPGGRLGVNTDSPTVGKLMDKIYRQAQAGA